MSEYKLPEKIYLQLGGDYQPDDQLDTGEVTWCDHRIFDTDVEYTRHQDPKVQAVVEAAKMWAEARDDMNGKPNGSLERRLYNAVKEWEE